MLFQSKSLHLKKIKSGILELQFCAPHMVNTLNTATLKSLSKALKVITHTPDLKGLILTSDKDSFIVGADINEFLRLFESPEEELNQWLQFANQLFNQLEDLSVPTISVLHGYTLGGGCECALATDFRIGDPTTNIGLPEIKLGIMPGFGGCVRLPRLIGADKAIEAIVQGNIFNAEQALKLGLLDAVADTDNRLDIAKKILQDAIDLHIDWRSQRQTKKSALLLPTTEQHIVFTTANQLLKQKVSVHYPAPFQAIKTIEKSAHLCRDQALNVERTHFLTLAKSKQAKALVGLYLNRQFLKNKAKKCQALTTKHIHHSAIIGAGIMGSGIALQFAAKGISVMLNDISSPKLQQGMAQIYSLLEQGLKKEYLSSNTMTKIYESIQPIPDNLKINDIDIIVESVVEDPQIKSSILKKLETQTTSQTILTSNTSTISIDHLADQLSRPENFCGLHFFNPVYKMPLVEVVRGQKTSEKTISAVIAFISKIGKSPIVVNDGPGFFVNRILCPYFLAFSQLIKEGYDFHHIDNIMENDFGWPMGPAHLLDFIGLDIAEHVQQIMSNAYPERMKVQDNNIISRLNATHQLGRKTGHGFYQYSANHKEKITRLNTSEVNTFIYSGTKMTQFPENQTIIDRLMIPMINEVIHCLEKNIIQSPAEADMALIYGLGFPTFRGGICRYLDTMGLSQYIQNAQPYTQLGAAYQVPESLKQMVAQRKCFYPLSFHQSSYTKRSKDVI